MVVGRTLWDFILEIFRTPGIGGIIIALAVLLELILILVLILVQGGLLDMRLSIGGSTLEMHQLVCLVWFSV